QFRSPITLLLLSAALLSLLLGETTDGLIVIGIIVASGVLGFWQEQRAADAVARLLARVRTRASVMRSGRRVEVPLEAVVPGDVVLLAAGDLVPGDARMLVSKDVYVDESALTGESYAAEKQPGMVDADVALGRRQNALFLGSHVVSGTATALVVHTGRQTVYGAISAELARRPPLTEFEHGVRQFGYLLLEIAAVMALAIFAINVALHRPVLDSLLFTLALTVGLTPQLLPAIVSITLAQGARQMARKDVIVRRLTAIEDIGGITMLCTDKTGTITEGVASVSGAFDLSGSPSDKVRLYAYLNAAFQSGYANPVDQAIRGEMPAGAAGCTKLDEVPFDFARKRLSVLAQIGHQRVMITKGALANVLAVCSAAEMPDGQRLAMDQMREQILERYQALSGEGYRCLGIAYRILDGEAPIGKESEHDMVFLGLISLSDPLKPGVRESLRQLRNLGIAVKVISGDNKAVATRVGREAGLNVRSVLTGAEVRHLTDAALMRRAARVDIFAEVEPDQKARIVLALKRSGRTVGYMGDGINDASALHAADVGISVDSAVDVTKRAADIVLLRKELGVLEDGVREGRRAFANTLKYVFITTSANFGNMFSMAGASLFSAFLPLLPKQILLLNVLSDLPAMAIAGDRLDQELVARPRRWDRRAIQRFMLTFGFISSAFDYLTFGALIALQTSAEVFRTGWFLESVLSEILILLVIRTRRLFFRSPVGRGLFIASIAVSIAVIALPYLPFAPALGFAPIPASLFLVIAMILALYIAASELAKRWFYHTVHL
ncbi:MAG TPA: magnesium-translocating P-type ATPase, partial [Burkholderiales bacterium]|nr:magnesium-translocating P-type ATPase [Burkholderiales bacterium]